MARGLNVPESGKILELGVSQNSLLPDFGRLFRTQNLSAIDRWPCQVQPPVTFWRRDLNRDELPFKDGELDMIFASEVLEHLFSPDYAVKEWRRVLKPGGVLFITTPNLAAWYNRVTFLFGYQPYWSVTSNNVDGLGKFARKQTPDDLLPFAGDGEFNHNRVYTYSTLRAFMAMNGFRILKQKGLPCYDFPPFLQRLDRFMSRRIELSSTVMLVMEKV